MKVSNALIVIGVVAVVGGVAWFRSTRDGSGAESSTPPAAAIPANSAPGPATMTAKEGELCPEPAPAGGSGVMPAGSSTAASANPGAAKKLLRVVDLGADKCIPCKMMAPILAELRKEYEGRVTVDFIDVWKNPDAGRPYKIRVIPTQIFFDADGKEVWRHEGFLPKEEFVKKFAEMGVK